MRIKDVARVELGAKNEDVSVMFDGKPTVFMPIFQLPDANALETHDRVIAKMEDLARDFPDGIEWEINFDTTPYTRESINEVFKTLRDAIILVADRGAGVPAELAVGDHSAGGRAGGDRRHVRGHGRVRLQPEQPDAVRPGAGDRHRGRRRDRGGRGGRASHRARAVAARRDDPGHAAGLRAGDRRGAGAQRRVRALRVHQRHHGSVLPAVRADDLGVDDHLGVQLADAQPGAGGAAAAAARRRSGAAAALAGVRAGRRLVGLRTRLASS